jgi:hypothetical protein
VNGRFGQRRLSLLALGLAVTACGGGESSSPDLAPITFDMSVHVPVAAELHTCEFVKMPERGGQIFVSGGDYTTTEGTHHFLLFRTSPGAKDLPLNKTVDCYEGDGLMQYERGYVTGGQDRSESAQFPPGLGLPFESGEILLFEGHFLNTSSRAVEAHVHVELDTVAASEVDYRVGTFRFYDPFIYLAPEAKARAAMRCHIHHDVTLLSAASHMHERGVGYRAYADIAGQSMASTPFYTTNDWQHPVPFEKPFRLPAGSALRYQCDYVNPSPFSVIQGLSATTNEMCMLSGFYYPEQDAAEEACTSMDMNGTGTRSCAQTLSCLSLCPPSDAPDFSPGHADVGPCFQQCIVDSCPNVTETLFPELECTEAKCKEACVKYDATCSQCIEVNCKAELDACSALPCGD